MKKIGAEFILGTIFIPVIAVLCIWVIDLQKADAVQMTKLEQLLELNQEIKADVKELKEKVNFRNSEDAKTEK